MVGKGWPGGAQRGEIIVAFPAFEKFSAFLSARIRKCLFFAGVWRTVDPMIVGLDLVSFAATNGQGRLASCLSERSKVALKLPSNRVSRQ